MSTLEVVTKPRPGVPSTSRGALDYCAQPLTEDGRPRCTAIDTNVGARTAREIERWFAAVRAGHRKEAGRQAVMLIVSLHPEDSRAAEIDDRELLDIGLELAARAAPGHAAAAFVHRDKAHAHVHVVLCSVHYETGSKVQIAPRDLTSWIAIKDEIDLEHGLRRTPLVEAQDRIPRGVFAVLDRGGYAWTEDLKTRIDVARAEAESTRDFYARLEDAGVVAEPHGSRARITYRFVDREGTYREITERRLGTYYGRKEIEREIVAQKERETEEEAGRSRRGVSGKARQARRVRRLRAAPEIEASQAPIPRRDRARQRRGERARRRASGSPREALIGSYRSLSGHTEDRAVAESPRGRTPPYEQSAPTAPAGSEALVSELLDSPRDGSSRRRGRASTDEAPPRTEGIPAMGKGVRDAKRGRGAHVGGAPTHGAGVERLHGRESESQEPSHEEAGGVRRVAPHQHIPVEADPRAEGRDPRARVGAPTREPDAAGIRPRDRGIERSAGSVASTSRQIRVRAETDLRRSDELRRLIDDLIATVDPLHRAHVEQKARERELRLARQRRRDQSITW